MSKILLACLVVLLVAVVSEAGPWGRGRGHKGGRRQRGNGAMMMMRGRGKGGHWRRKWDIGHKAGVNDVDDANAFSSDDNIPVHSTEVVSRRPVARRPWKLRRKMRRRNKFHKVQQANGTSESDVTSAWKAKWMAKKHRRQNRWRAMLEKRGCFCLSPEKLQALRQFIVDEGMEDEFPEIVPDDFLDDNDDTDVDDDEDDVDEIDKDDNNGDNENVTIENVTTEPIEETDIKLPILQ